MDLSIVITHHRNIQLLRQCLKSFQEEIKDMEVEIIVVCSEYKAEMPADLRREFPEVIFLPFAQNIYHVRSVNKGLGKAKGEFIFVVNDDVAVAAANSFLLMMDYLKEDPAIGLLGPKLLNSDGSWQKSYFRFYTPLTIICRRTILGRTKMGQRILDEFLNADKDLNNRNGVEVDWVRGAAMFTRRELVRKIGLLEEKFWHYFGDVDWCRRFWQNGYKVVYFPQAIFYHHHEKSSGGRGVVNLLFNRMTRMHLWDGMKYFWKWKGQS